MRSVGGNPTATRQAGHPQWDSGFDSWDAFPPADAGTVTTTTTNVANASAGNTIAFTYTAPSGGVREASLLIDVPLGWTPPVTTDTPGCTVATVGTLTASGQAITVSALTLPPKGQTVITYGATSSGSCTPGDGATAPAAAGAPGTGDATRRWPVHEHSRITLDRRARLGRLEHAQMTNVGTERRSVTPRPPSLRATR